MIAGKGHEQGQEFEGGRKIPFDDRDVARAELEALRRRAGGMIDLSPERIADAAGLEILAEGPPGRPERAVIDSREVAQGDLFFGLPGEHADGGEFAPGALADGAWGVVCLPQHARAAAREDDFAWVFSTSDPLARAPGAGSRVALGARTRRWWASPARPGRPRSRTSRRRSCPFRAHASPENYNTEIGLPLAILAAPPGTEVLVLEMAMRGVGQIAELCEIAEPDVGVITNVGPVHLELLGTLEAIAEAKAEILARPRAGGAGDRPGRCRGARAAPRRRARRPDVRPRRRRPCPRDVDLRALGGRRWLALPRASSASSCRSPRATTSPNALAAIAIGVSLGADLAAMARRAADITFSRLRGEHHELRGGITLVNDCYNANPISMHAALESLAEMPGRAERSRCSAGWPSWGRTRPTYHREIGSLARGLGIGPVIGVGELARDYAPDEWAPDPSAAVEIADGLLGDGDVVLVKGSRSVGLEHFSDELIGRRGDA